MGSALVTGRWGSSAATRTGGGHAPVSGETDAEITVDNGRIRSVISNEHGGRLTSLRLDDQDLIAADGRSRTLVCAAA